MNTASDLDGDVESGDDRYVYIVMDEQPADEHEAYTRSTTAQPLLGPEGKRGSNERVFRVDRRNIESILLSRGWGWASREPLWPSSAPS